MREQGQAAGAAASGLDKLRARTTLLLDDLRRLSEPEHQRQLSRIRREQEASLDEAKSRGSGQQTIDRIKERAKLETELAGQQEQERKERDQKRIDDRSRQLRLQAEVDEIAADLKLSSFQKLVATSAAELRDQLSDPTLNAEQCGLIQRVAKADEQLAISRAADEQVWDIRQQRQQALSLDVADLFTRNPATALSIGRPVSDQEENARLNEDRNAILERIEQNLRDGGIPGG